MSFLFDVFGSSSSAAPPPKKPEPCQSDYDRYLRCIKEHGGTIDMVDCEDIALTFQKCMRTARAGARRGEDCSGGLGKGADDGQDEYAGCGSKPPVVVDVEKFRWWK